MAVDPDIVRRVRDRHLRALPLQEPRVDRWVECVAAKQPMLAEQPEIPGTTYGFADWWY